ncbi:MAG TPA: hypothetical protein VG650_18625 [Mycobacteriales bacterium]|nr:hypothetical protein [Mycobacteriales bacterium]
MERVYLDFLKRDAQGRVRLTTIGTREDLRRLNITLSDGLRLLVYSDDEDASGTRDDLLAEGTVRFDTVNGSWVIQIDEGSLRHASDGA